MVVRPFFNVIGNKRLSATRHNQIVFIFSQIACIRQSYSYRLRYLAYMKLLLV
jgi:hypothetical protein